MLANVIETPELTAVDNQGADKRTLILKATESLIATRGFDSVRLRDVSRAAKVSIGTIQHYFGTRDELLWETSRSSNWRRAKTWATVADGIDDPNERLGVLLEQAIADRERCVLWVETCAVSARNPKMHDDMELIYSAWREAFIATIHAGLESGDFVTTDQPARIADTLIALIDGCMTALAIELVDFDQAYVRRMLRESADRLLAANSA